ncbi:hypothetical protein [Trinickia diaoshuihuensis]|uniref:hypothetical protein n=1 Tax=Trinickia diaoshuihuensis TaxID=2292265 RepID=UPI000E22C1CF|nr:hypothetical protein [Trinickia diaoshuihuensis]
MHYPLVEPEKLSEAQHTFITQFVRTIELVSVCSRALVGAKDTHSRNLAASDPYAQIVGLSCGADVAGRMDCDLPCEDVAQFAECYVRSDMRLLNRTHVGATQTVLNIHRYATGLKALVFDKSLLKHHPSQSIVGIVYSAYETNLKRFTALFPTYWTQFGFGCSIERVDHPAVDGLGRLSSLEHEVAFLLALGLDAEAIAHFLPRLRPGPGLDVDAALFGLADKAVAAGVAVADLRECLVEAHVHQRMPKSFFGKVVGVPI